MTKNIMIVGVGGQGSLLASRIIGHAAMEKGLDVSVSEVHGMSQRGGSVVTYVKFASKVYSPIISEGEADIILSFEKLEAARWLPFLKKDGVIITNTQEINPMPVVAGAMEYPENIIENITAQGANVDAFDALTLAEDAGSAKCVNVVLIGRLAKYGIFTEDELRSSVNECVPKKLLEINQKAFENGLKKA